MSMMFKCAKISVHENIGFYSMLKIFQNLLYSIQILPSLVLIACHDLSCNDEVLPRQPGSQNSETCHFWLQNLSRNSPTGRRKETEKWDCMIMGGTQIIKIFWKVCFKSLGFRVLEGMISVLKQGLWNWFFDLELRFSPNGKEMDHVKWLS